MNIHTNTTFAAARLEELLDECDSHLRSTGDDVAADKIAYYVNALVHDIHNGDDQGWDVQDRFIAIRGALRSADYAFADAEAADEAISAWGRYDAVQAGRDRDADWETVEEVHEAYVKADVLLAGFDRVVELVKGWDSGDDLPTLRPTLYTITH